MTITETVLVFVVIPLAVVLVIYGIVFGGSAARSKRYRPGRPFATAPVWFLAEETPGVTAGAPKPALVSAADGDAGHGEVGGASDSW